MRNIKLVAICLFLSLSFSLPAFAGIELIWTTTNGNDNPVTVYDGAETQNAGLPITVTRRAEGRYTVWLNRELAAPFGVSVTPFAVEGGQARHCAVSKPPPIAQSGVVNTAVVVECAIPDERFADTGFALLITHGEGPSAARFLRYGTSYYDTTLGHPFVGTVQRGDTFPRLTPLDGRLEAFQSRTFTTGPAVGDGKAVSLNTADSIGENCRSNSLDAFDEFSHNCSYVPGIPSGGLGHYVLFREGLPNVSAVSAIGAGQPVGPISKRDEGTFGDTTFRMRRHTTTSYRIVSNRPLDHVQIEATGSAALCSITSRNHANKTFISCLTHNHSPVATNFTLIGFTKPVAGHQLELPDGIEIPGIDPPPIEDPRRTLQPLRRLP